ncbi:sulfotransferase family 2 domain-containing protein [Priestia megaterium]|uniref:sulfotransferase family 2 domain-containing protein n=1 Tax=Priestia megaterium TaxID=1404 RepID=UPI00203ABF16|nr:sulfotransferase family 2 domain-containing protein [Priestia megaterium]MCM3197160.1 sulfotransferase family protein [Priestia megaterium]
MAINDNLNLIMKRTPLYNQAFPLILFWSPKSGCTSLTKWFFFQINLLDEALAYQPFVHVYRDEVYNNNLEHLQCLKKTLSREEKSTIKLVRNPYTRAISSFLHVLNYDTVRGAPFRESLQSLCRQNKGQGISFKQFLYAVKKVGTDLHSIDGHVAQQYIDGEERWVNDYVKLENFNRSILELEKNHNLLKSPIDKLSQSEHHHSVLVSEGGEMSECYAEKLMTKEILLKGNLPSYDKFYDQETLELCRELYIKDFQTYNYKSCNKNFS